MRFKFKLICIAIVSMTGCKLFQSDANTESAINGSIKLIFMGELPAGSDYARLVSGNAVNVMLNIQSKPQSVVFENLPEGELAYYLDLQSGGGRLSFEENFSAEVRPGRQTIVYVNLSPAEQPTPLGNYDDSWYPVQEGVAYMRRDRKNKTEHFHTAYIDLTNTQLQVIVTRPEQRARRPSSFGQAVNAIVTINGDMFNKGNNYQPQGLSIGQGALWPNTQDKGANIRYLACTNSVPNRCEIDSSEQPSPVRPDWFNVVGGDGLIVDKGEVTFKGNSDCSGSGCKARTSVGLNSGNTVLIMNVVEGEYGAVAGFGLKETGYLMRSLGAYSAINLDGGGSTSMAVRFGGSVSGVHIYHSATDPFGLGFVNHRPSGEPIERVVANHLAIVSR